MTNFTVDLIENLPKLNQIEIDGVRHYTDNNGLIKDPLPSVTTVLSADPSKKKSLKNWRDRVGEERANAISTRALAKGNDVHLLMEDYLLSMQPHKKMMPNVIELASFLKKVADDHINNIRLVEGQLFSTHLRVAGTVDLVADYDGETAIIDWKTSRYPKKEQHIHNYFMQESAYAVMFEERTQIPVRKLVTLVAHPEGAQVFVESRDTWIDKFIAARDKYDTYR